VHTALRSTGDGASAVAWKLHRRLSVSGIAAPLRVASLSHPEAPNVVAAVYNLGDEYVELAVA
jgi:hypothetical protein